MHLDYTPEEIRTLLAEHETLEYASATDADVAEAADVLEGVEQLVGKLEREVRRRELLAVSFPVGEYLWIPAAKNCSRTAGVAISPEGSLSFVVTVVGTGGATGGASGDDFLSYFSARQAAAHALLGGEAPADDKVNAPADDPENILELAPQRMADEDAVLSLLKRNGWAVAAGRTLADIDAGVLARVCRLSEGGVAHLFSESGGIVLAMAGSTEGDRRRALEALPKKPGRAYSSRASSVLFECGEAGSHYSEEPTFGCTLKAAPRPREGELDDAAERFRASRFVRPSHERPLDVEAIRRRVRQQVLVRGAVRHALAVDPADAEETLLRVVAVVLIARVFSRMIVRRALAAKRPWDKEVERGRMENVGRKLRSEMISEREARGKKPVEVAPAAALDAERRKRLARPAEDPDLRRSIERRRKGGRAAYDTARAVYLQRCPGLAHKLLHLLRRGGVSPEAAFVSRHLRLAEGAASPEEALRAALRSLGEAGTVRRVCSAKTGAVFLVATEPLDETGFRRSLNALIRDERFGIVNPWVDSSAARADGAPGEWEEGLEDLETSEVEGLAPRRLRDTELRERPLPEDDLIAEPSAQEELEAIAEGARVA